MSNPSCFSGIPVRNKRPEDDAKKIGTTYCKQSKSKHQTSKTVHFRKGYTERKTEKERLLEETERLQNELSDYKETVVTAQQKLDQEQEKLRELQKSAEEKENRLTGELEELKLKNTAVENTVTSYEKKLLMCGINPVTLESLDPDSKKDEMIKKRETTQKNVELLKKRITCLNEDSSELLEKMKSLGEHIDQIAEGTSVMAEET